MPSPRARELAARAARSIRQIYRHPQHLRSGIQSETIIIETLAMWIQMALNEGANNQATIETVEEWARKPTHVKFRPADPARGAYCSWCTSAYPADCAKSCPYTNTRVSDE